MRDILLFSLAPYAAAALLVCVPAVRCFSSAARRSALVAASRTGAPLYPGALVWRWGLGLLLCGHVVAFLVPRPLLLWNRSFARLLVLEGAGLAFGVAALAGLLLLLAWRARPGQKAGAGGLVDSLLLALLAVAIGSGLAAALLYRWGSSWYAIALLPYFRSLVALHPAVALVAPLPPLVKLHLLAGVAAAAVLPFSRAVYALLGPPVRLWLALSRRLRPAVARAVATALEAALAGAFALLLVGAVGRVGSSRGYSPAQPIAFSHRLHAGTHQIPCLYCHFAAERSRHAGIPPAGVCMNCHGQLKVATPEVEKLKEAVAQRRPLAWTKVHNLPDFVYFNHGQHVLRGVACRRCHGPVETMARVRQVAPLTMGWCLDCHRRERVVPAEQRAAGAAPGPQAATGGTDCSKCHY
jgi:nitrate reductase gamma subunit